MAMTRDRSLDFIWEQMANHIVLTNGDKFNLLDVKYLGDYGAYNVRFEDRVTGRSNATLIPRERVAEATGKMEIDGYHMKAVPAHPDADVITFNDVKSPPTESAEVSRDQADEVRRALIELLCDVYVDGVQEAVFPEQVSEYATDMADRFLQSVYEEILSDPHREEGQEVVDDSFDPRPDEYHIPELGPTLPPWIVKSSGPSSVKPLTVDDLIDLWTNAEDDS